MGSPEALQRHSQAESVMSDPRRNSLRWADWQEQVPMPAQELRTCRTREIQGVLKSASSCVSSNLLRVFCTC